jgi:signal peptidase II
MMTRSMRVLFILSILCGCVGCDQATKAIARERLPAGTTISMLHDTLRLQRTENIGAFLSVGESLPRNVRSAVFVCGALLIVMLGVSWALFARGASPIQVAGAALASAGGLGNVIDRLICSGRVTDFLNVGIGPVRTGIFNVADMALMLGFVLLLIPLMQAEPRGSPR